MEKSLIQLKELFHLKDQDLRKLFSADSGIYRRWVYELVIRTILVKKGNCPVNQLHKKASSLVKAATVENDGSH